MFGVTFFSGGGGCEAGFVQAGIKPVTAVEFDPNNSRLSNAIADIHDLNFPECNLIRNSLQQVAATNFEAIPRNPTVLWSSPPCQYFSAASGVKRSRFSDIECALDTVAAVFELQPQHFLLEQVPGYAKSQAFELIIKNLRSRNWNCEYSVVDMSRYSPTPQARERVILRASLGEVLPLPPKREPMGWWDAIADLIDDLPSANLIPAQEMALSKCDYTTPVFLGRTGRIVGRAIPAHLPIPTITCSLFRDQRMNARSRFADIWLPSAKLGGGNFPHQTSSVKQVSIECIRRLMGFPDWYQLPEDIAIAGSALGNAVCPSFVAELLRAIR